MSEGTETTNGTLPSMPKGERAEPLEVFEDVVAQWLARLTADHGQKAADAAVKRVKARARHWSDSVDSPEQSG